MLDWIRKGGEGGSRRGWKEERTRKEREMYVGGFFGAADGDEVYIGGLGWTQETRKDGRVRWCE
jgi:hypothetical protein